MPERLFFDPETSAKGSFFTLTEPVQSRDGKYYELDEWLGRGGNATVFRARLRSTGDECAIKFLLTPSMRAAKRFLRETRLLGSIQDAHIVRFLGAGTVTAVGSKSPQARPVRLPFMVMELAECNLAQLVARDLPHIKYEHYSGQFRGLARALAVLHSENAIHRDIKPENILVGGERWLLGDYGLCTSVDPTEGDLTPPGGNLGPKYWLSPEAHNRRLGNGDSVCAASDVFQLAAVFWFVVTGRHPCGILSQEDWHGPDKLFECLYKSLLHRVSARPQNGAEFLAQLEEALLS